MRRLAKVARKKARHEKDCALAERFRQEAHRNAVNLYYAPHMGTA